MTQPQKLLGAAALASFAIAIVHVAAIFGGESFARFFNAPPLVLAMIQQRSLWIIPVVLVLCGVLSTFGLYAWSGAGRMRRLPLLRTGLVTVGAIYFLRGLLLGPLVVFAVRHPGGVSWQSFAFCIVSLLLGLAYLAGTFGQWRILAHAADPRPRD